MDLPGCFFFFGGGKFEDCVLEPFGCVFFFNKAFCFGSEAVLTAPCG